jgi:hypothetical protein
VFACLSLFLSPVGYTYRSFARNFQSILLYAYMRTYLIPFITKKCLIDEDTAGA